MQIGDENEECMLLSDTAKSIALPMLLCSEEDVEGNHSCSAGKIGEKELFYIMSRGFSQKEAMKLMVKAKFNKILENIEQFVKLGFKISMDDYGNGYSNIRRFIDYPIHTVKLDRIFVTNLINEKPTIVEDSISLFKHMNCKVVAEGVETKELKDQLNEYGVDYIQGYYYSKPLSEFDFVNFMQKENNEDEQK